MSFAADLRHLWKSRGFRILTWVRLASQGGDGAFQVGIVTAFFFDPNAGATPVDIAAGFAIMFAPFTLAGPLVGPFIDRWHRQRIVVVGNLIRIGMVAGIIGAILADAPRPVLYGLALATLSINRFLNAALSAGIPQVVEREDLLTANAILPTLGTIAAALGATIGGVASFVWVGVSEDQKSLIALVGAAVAFGTSSWIGTALSRSSLGPEATVDGKRAAAQTVHLVRELAEGVRHLRERVTPFHALGVMAATRLLYGLMFVSSILISRGLLGGGAGGLKGFTAVLAFAAAGFGLAAILTPTFAHRIDRHRWIVLCLVIAAVGQTMLAISSAPWALFSAALVISFAVQSGKIGVDTIVQKDTDDAFRGRAFVLYDVAYNVAYILSAAIGAIVLPDNGYSHVVMGALVVAYLATAFGYAKAPRGARAPSPTPVEPVVPGAAA